MSRKKKGTQFPNPMMGPSRGAPAVTQQLALQLAYEEQWKTFFIRLALGRFKWNGLPDSVSPRYLEWTLLMQNRVIFFEGRNERSLEKEMLALGVIPQGRPDIYGNLHEYAAQGANGEVIPIDPDGGVIMYDSLGRYPVWTAIENAVRGLVKVEMKQDSNLDNQDELFMVEVPEQSKQDATRVINAMRMNEKAFVVSREFQENTRSGLFTSGAEYKQALFHEDRTAKLNNAYLMLGIDHVPFEKSSHLLESEADKSTDAVMRIRDDLLSARREAIDEINKKWGTNITVEWNSGDENTDEETTEEETTDE